jgi:hypothetical protein
MGRSGSVRKRRDTPGWFSRGFSYLIMAGYSRQAISLHQAAGLSDQLLSKKTRAADVRKSTKSGKLKEILFFGLPLQNGNAVNSRCAVPKRKPLSECESHEH